MRMLASLVCFLGLQAAALAKEPAPTYFTVTPESIREQVLKNNLSLIAALNSVHDAKDKVNIARASLLPAANLGGLLTLTGGPTFVLSSAEFLLPFLVPSNWSDLSQEKHLFEAEKISYQVIQLNTYGSALSLYFTILGDRETETIYRQAAKDLIDIFEILREQEETLGTARAEDVQQAEAQAKMALLRASKLAELAKQELASLRKALGLPLSAVLTLEPRSMEPSEWEASSVFQASEAAKRVSPEYLQIEQLVRAAQAGKWSRTFGFVNSSSLAGQSGSAAGPSNVSFSRLSGRTSVSLGFAIFPKVHLASRAIEEMKLQSRQLEQEHVRLLESTLGSLEEAQKQFQLASEAEEKMRTVYDTRLEQYDFGIGQFIDVLLARTQMAEASAARIKAMTDLNLLRITLHRTMLTDQFSAIQGCRARSPSPKKTGSFWKWLKQLFGADSSGHADLDALCTGSH